METTLRACATCGLVHRAPAVGPGFELRCTRCDAALGLAAHPASESRTAALAAAALLLYVPALTLPAMTIERLGHETTTSVSGGVVTLLAEGHWAVGGTVLVFSVVAPVAKLAALFALSFGGRAIAGRPRAWIYRAVEIIGRWGMLDVLLIATLVAAVKLGDVVRVTPGPGATVFGAVVALSLLASMSFDPRAIWRDDEDGGAA